MRLVLAARISGESRGGVARVMQSLANEWEKSGDSVTIVWKKGKPSGFDFLLFPVSLFIIMLRTPCDALVAHSHDSIICSVFKFLLPGKPRIVMHSHGWEERAFASWKKYGNQYGFAPKLINRIIAALLRHPLLRLNLRLADACVFVSDEDLNFVSERCLSQKPKLHCVYNGYNPSVFTSEKKVEKDSKRVLFVGNWTWKKGNVVLIKLIGEILDKNKEVLVRMVGLGLTGQKKQALFKDNTRIEFYENAEPAEMHKHYMFSDVLIHPGFFEGGIPCLTLLEAAACLLPVVAFSYEGLERIYKHRVHALLCVPGDFKKMADSCMELLDNKILAEQLSRNAKEKFSGLTINKSAKQMRGITNNYRIVSQDNTLP